jgi:hypothetical protein
MPDISIHRIERLDLRFVPQPWAFAQDRREEIDAYFERLQRDKPLWNGRVLLMFEHALEAETVRGSYLETDFASFIAWRDWGFPDKSMRNCFAPAALQAADGAYILGVMGGHTANAGQVYFPCGTPDPDDVKDGRVDLESSSRRELFEETGIAPAELDIATEWHAILAGPRIALVKQMRARHTAEVLRERIRGHIARENEPELADICIVRSAADITSAMPLFVRRFLENSWR